MRDRFLRVIVLGVLASACWASAATAATSPALVGSTSNSASLSGAEAVAVSGHYAYEVSYWSGQLNVIDISNPAAPTIVPGGSTPSTVSMTAATNITISGHYAFVTSKNRNASPMSDDDLSGNSLTIVDVSNPAGPAVVGAVHAPGGNGNVLFGAYAVAVSGNFAYVASQGNLGAQGQPSVPLTSAGSFSVIDITNPSGPTLVPRQNIDNSALTGALDQGLNHATSVAISGHYAFVTAFNSQRLTTIDISNPAAPVAVHSLHDATSFPAPNDVVVNGGYAYVVNQTAAGLELAAVNISNPLAPTIAATLSDPSLLGAYRVRTRGNFIYVSANSAAAVAAIDVSSPGAPRLAGSLTDAAHLANVTGLDVSSTGRYIITASPRLATEAQPSPFPPYPLQTGGPTVTGTVSVIDLDPSPISVTIVPASEPASLTAQTSAAFSFGVNDAVATVRCSLDHSSFVACTSQSTATYASLKSGTHTFTVQATDAAGISAQASYTWTVTGPPSATALPRITGIAQQGKRLSASTGTWSGAPAPTFSYQWQRCNAKGNSCKSISKQTKTTYKLTAADVGSRVAVVVTGKNSSGSATARSAPTNVVKWSSGSFARAKLSHSATATPGLSLSVPSPGGGLLLKRLVISLPKGLSFAGSHRALASGLVLKSRSGKRLALKVSLNHGTLTIALTKPTAGVTLSLARGLVGKTSAFAKVKGKSLKLTVSLSYQGKPVRRGNVKLGLS
ncbi:MAG: hypothetical protein M3070_17700 [Actinomycetota bacterium]|nr:hypothetical protein [Actinomycetota bacterium]